MSQELLSKPKKSELILLEKFVANAGHELPAESLAHSGLLIYSYPGKRRGPAQLVIKGRVFEDLAAYLAGSAPEIYAALVALLKKGSLLLDLDRGLAWRPYGHDTSPDTAKVLEALRTMAIFPNSFTNLKRKSKVVSIILGGGKGTRMRSKDLHKVCFPIAGRPAINRLLDQIESVGVSEHIIVVGEKGEQVVREVTEVRDNVSFVYQINQNGTGNAAKQAAYLLLKEGVEGDVLVILGDKVLERDVLIRLRDHFEQIKADLVLVTAEKKDWPDSGRIVCDTSGRPCDIIEKRDIQKMHLSYRLLDLKKRKPGTSSRTLLKEITKVVPSLPKARIMFPELMKFLEKGAFVPLEKLKILIPEDDIYYRMQQDGEACSLSAEELELVTPTINASVYLYTAKAFYNSVFAIQSDNAQKEEYLTDVVRILARDSSRPWKISTIPVNNRYEVLSFNNPEELLAIEEYYTRKEFRKDVSVKLCERIDEKYRQHALRSPDEWLRIFDDFGPGVRRRFEEIYGEDERIFLERRKAYLDVLDKYVRVYGKNGPVILARSPGRVNLMGRHVEHRGGYTNYMTINHEMILAAGVREDDVINIHNVDARQFRPRSFSIGNEISYLPWDEWLNMIDSETVRRMIHSSQGDWSNYFKAAALRLQENCRDRLLYGFNGVLSGQIPLAAGLSSSSAVVVSAAEALTFINGLSLVPKEFVDLCGEGEWFVGTRGGSGDHAAMKFGERGNVIHMGFHEVRIEDIIPFPKDYRLLILHSYQYAKKSTGAMQKFNEKVATYEIAHELVKLRFPQFKDRLRYFRDINTGHLGLEPYEIYDIFSAIPERITRKELMNILPREQKDRLEKIFSSHREPDGGYQARRVALFGLAEIARAREFARLMKQGEVEKAGRLMFVSHDGDRVTRLTADGKRARYHDSPTDKQIASLRKRLAAGDPDAALYLQPGGYECSTPLIDEMVDLSSTIQGVIGAQLSGAGLGGCIMVLVKEEAVELFQRKIIESFYEKYNLPPHILNCNPIAGSGIFYI